MWERSFTDEFEHWWDGLDLAQQAALAGRVELLGEHGPDTQSCCSVGQDRAVERVVRVGLIE